MCSLSSSSQRHQSKCPPSNAMPCFTPQFHPNFPIMIPPLYHKGKPYQKQERGKTLFKSQLLSNPPKFNYRNILLHNMIIYQPPFILDTHTFPSNPHPGEIQMLVFCLVLKMQLRHVKKVLNYWFLVLILNYFQRVEDYPAKTSCYFPLIN